MKTLAFFLMTVATCLSACNQTGECINHATPADATTKPTSAPPPDRCPDPLSSYDPDGAMKTVFPSWDPDTVIGGLLAPMAEPTTCSTLVVGLSTAGSCTKPADVDLVAGVLQSDGSLLVRLLTTQPVNEVVKDDSHSDYHLTLPDALHVAFTEEERPVIGMRVPDGVCPVEIAPACGARAVVATPDGATLRPQTFLFGLEDCHPSE